jgi:hypothetical protein
MTSSLRGGSWIARLELRLAFYRDRPTVRSAVSGRSVRAEVICLLHNFRFNITTGSCSSDPVLRVKTAGSRVRLMTALHVQVLQIHSSSAPPSNCRAPPSNCRDGSSSRYLGIAPYSFSGHRMNCSRSFFRSLRYDRSATPFVTSPPKTTAGQN